MISRPEQPQQSQREKRGPFVGEVLAMLYREEDKTESEVKNEITEYRAH
jgi:hypothetical protein